MINAKEARRKTLLATRAKDMMEVTEKAILNSIEYGKSETNIEVTRMADEEIVKDVIIPELISLGYKAEFISAEPMLRGCPSDQWLSCDHLHISWEV